MVPTLWDPRGWNPNWVLTVVTTLYVIVAVFQLLAIRRQTSALGNLEAAKLFIADVKLMPDGKLIEDSTVEVSFKNHGRTLGVVTSYCIESRVLKVTDKLPDSPRYERVHRTFSQTVVLPDEFYRAQEPHGLNSEQIESVRKNDSRL